MSTSKNEQDRLIAALTFLALAFIYGQGRSETFGPGDSPQHVLSALTWGVSIAPGYPLYVLLGRLASMLPGGSPAAHVNALSGIFHALAAALFFLTLRRMDLKALPALIATALMALSPLYWYYSEIAEVRALNDLLAVGTAYAALIWTQERRPAALWALSALAGLGIGHHPTYALILPALGYWLWSHGALNRRQAAWFAVLVAVFCALPYLLLGLRLRWSMPLYNPDDARTWTDLWALFTRRHQGGLFRMVSGTGLLGFEGFDAGRLFAHAAYFLRSSAHELTPPGVLLAGLGAVSLGKGRRETLVFWGLWFFFAAFCFILVSSQQFVLWDELYHGAVLRRFHLLPLVALFALAGFGTQWLLDRARARLGWLFLAAAVAAPLSLRPISLRDHDPLLEYARLIVESSEPGALVVLASDDSIFATQYLEIVEGSTGDRVFLTPTQFAHGPYIQKLRSRPGLKIPPPGPRGLTTDWREWIRLNPGRPLYAEVLLKEAVAELLPDSAPSGILIEARKRPPGREKLLVEARRLLAWLSRDSMTSSFFPFTQEVYLARSYSSLLEAYARLLGPHDPALAGEFASRLAALRRLDRGPGIWLNIRPVSQQTAINDTRRPSMSFAQVSMKPALILVFGISLLALAVAFWLIQWVMAKDTGTNEMRKISDAIKSGAEAFLRRQNNTIILLAAISAAVIFVLYAFVRTHTEHDPASPMILALCTTASFVMGALCSVTAGYIGMWVSIRSNIRTAAAARTSLNDALRIALRGGAVSGLFVTALSLLGVGGLFALLKLMGFATEKIPFMIVGYGFGASFVALFAQLGGGIYTKAADVGADLVGKVEAGIPEDDPRNPAVIADLVGDNVGDCAGRGADLFESTAAENIGAMILGVGLIPYFGWKGILFPLVARALGILASIAGILVVKTEEHEDPMDALNIGYYLTSVLAAAGFIFAAWWLLRSEQAPNAWMYYSACGLIGILTAQAFVYITQYYTEYKYRPVLSIAEASQTGPATNIIAGVAVGLECTAIPVLVISAAILASYKLGAMALGAGGGGGLFGTAVATMGMLGTAAYILAMDTFGPITDNAGGIVEMSRQPEAIRKKTDRLDAVGNTTKALTKGYAIGSAALAAFLLFSAYLDEIFNYTGRRIAVDLSKPEVFIGAMLGAMLVFLFSALAIRAVGKAAYDVINEVRRQFKERPGIMKGTESPDYGQCVDIVTLGALKAMILPGVLAVAGPILVGLIFRVFITQSDPTIAAEAVAALLMVGTIAGILMALFLNNSGGAWDNAKKYVETGAYGGKRSDTHKATVVGDTVGDPFKDTAGPSLHVLIKLLATITLVLAPLFL